MNIPIYVCVFHKKSAALLHVLVAAPSIVAFSNVKRLLVVFLFLKNIVIERT